MYNHSMKLLCEQTNIYENGNLGLVAAATKINKLKEIRALAPRLPILSPGVGVQGGDPQQAYKAGQGEEPGCILIHQGREAIYDPFMVEYTIGGDFADQTIEHISSWKYRLTGKY